MILPFLAVGALPTLPEAPPLPPIPPLAGAEDDAPSPPPVAELDAPDLASVRTPPVPKWKAKLAAERVERNERRRCQLKGEIEQLRRQVKRKRRRAALVGFGAGVGITMLVGWAFPVIGISAGATVGVLAGRAIGREATRLDDKRRRAERRLAALDSVA